MSQEKFQAETYKLQCETYGRLANIETNAAVLNAGFKRLGNDVNILKTDVADLGDGLS